MIRQEDPTQLRFLGTGCAEPSKYRAASGIHLQLKNRYGILIDAGEGSFGQMVKYYGAQQAAKQASADHCFYNAFSFSLIQYLAGKIMDVRS